MTLRMVALVASVALALAGCGGGRKESRERAQASARGDRGERRGEAQGERGGERGRGEARGRTGEEQRQAAGAGEKQPRVPATPEALLGRDTVETLQQALSQRGLLRQHQQGELDPPTREAVRRFQQQQGYATTGVPDKQTLSDLGVSAEEAYGSGGGGRG